MKLLNIAFMAASVLMPLAAQATDLPRPVAASTPAFGSLPANWTGAYLGAFVGYGQVNSEFTDTEGSLFAEGGPINNNINALNGGLSVGYNWQVRSAVIGVEADWGVLPAKRTVGLDDPADFHRTQWSDLGTLRARFGFAFDNVLLYGTAGFAFAGVKDRITIANFRNTCEVSVEFCVNDRRIGFAYGAGVEMQLDRNWSLKAEVIVADFQSIDLNQGDDTMHFETSAEIGRVGLNYKLF